MAIELGGRPFPEIELIPGETINHVWQADGFFLGANPIAKMMAAVKSFMVTITGGHLRIFLVLTNMRVLLVESTAQWCGCTKTRNMNAIAATSIKEAGTAKETHMCCIHTRLVHVQSLTERHTLIVKKFKDEDLTSFLTHLSEHIINNTTNV